MRDTGIRAAYAAPISEPALVPTTTLGKIRCS